MFGRDEVARLLSVITLSSTLMSGCGGPDDYGLESDDVGGLELLLSNAPADAGCLHVKVSGSRSVEQAFDVAPGVNAKFSLDRLPVGQVQVDASAFATACAEVRPSSVPSWLLDKPVKARVDALQVVKILLKLVHNGQAEVTVDFEDPPWVSTATSAVDLAIIGDTPYGAAQIEDFPNLLTAIGQDARVSSIIHLGDIKNGSSRCDDAYFLQIFAGFSSSPRPLVYTPGDNEWTDCHRASNGAYDPIRRLDRVREIFFPVPGLALGAGFKQVLAQSERQGFEKFVENQLWFEAGVAFATVHVVGSNDSKVPWYTDDTSGTKQDEPERRDAERTARSRAALAWLDELFSVAAERSAAGVVVAMQADMFDAYSVANNLPLDAFDDVVQRLASLSRAFAKPVLLLEGDSHVFIADQPLAKGNPLHGVTEPVPNLTRIVVQGSTTAPLTEWLRLHVDPRDPAVFSWQRNPR